MFGFWGFGGSASDGAPPPIGAPGRGGSVLGTPSNVVISAAGGPEPMSGLGNRSSSASVYHGSLDTRSESFSRFGGGNQTMSPLMFGGAASINVGDGGSSSAARRGGYANMSNSQLGLVPRSGSAVSLSNIPVFGTGDPLPSHSPGPVPIVANPAASIPASAAPIFATPVFSTVLPLPSMPGPSGGGILGGCGSSRSGNRKNARALGTAAPVLPSAATQSTPGASDAGSSVLGSAFAGFGTTGKGGNAPVPSVTASAAALPGVAASATFPATAPANVIVKGSVFRPKAATVATESPSLAPVAVPPSSVFGASVLGSASTAAVAAPSAVTPAAPPPPAAAKTSATDANRSGSFFGDSSSAFSAPPPKTPAPITSAFGTALPGASGSALSARPSGQQAAPLDGSKEPASFHVNPFARTAFSAGAASTPAATTSAFSPAASVSGPVGGGGSVFSAAAATPACSPASSFGASAASVKAPPPPASSKALGNGADGGGAAAGRRRSRSVPRSNVAESDGSGSGGPARPHSSSLDPAASPPAQGSRFEVPAPRHRQRQRASLPSHAQNPPSALLLMNTLPIPPLPADEKKLCIAARLCKSLLIQLAPAATSGDHGRGGASSSRDEDIVKALEHAFFGVVGIEGVHGDFGKTAGEMLTLWNGHVRPMVASRGTRDSDDGSVTFPGEMWIALFALGTYLNTILSTLQSAKAGSYAVSSSAPASMTDLAAYKAGLRAHPVEALTDACHYANELSELLLTLFQRGGEADAPPYSVIPVVLRRVRSVFDEATARGVATVQSNLNTVTSKLFGVLNRRVKTSAVQPLQAPGEAPRWLLTRDSKEKECLLYSFACLIIEMIAADAPMNDDVDLFIEAFHRCFPSALAERCMLYYRRACALLRQPLRMSLVEEAAALLAKATVVYPLNAPLHNKRVLLVKLLAAELALGRLPPDEDWLALEVPQLVDVVNALKTSRLDLLDAALATHGPFFVTIGVHNVLCLARQRIALLMVVKFYLKRGCESRLCVSEMVRYHRLPYSTADAGVVWLLPLLVEKQINGVLDHDYLILSAKAPFDTYRREALADAAATA
ncbi:hypothetical protein GH5_04842 [Leishmania sp. Ghana 2012 LV757]|uniref:hypothetical protein n=1 Tax=Leishmania sp. Ghana 2012 LV757 TaxID=2803181 RepID=UPI001B796C22|nr:hypothetical protein GH5_04842 [Leishmania sp. Ghana 2012 LV757]